MSVKCSKKNHFELFDNNPFFSLHCFCLVIRQYCSIIDITFNRGKSTQTRIGILVKAFWFAFEYGIKSFPMKTS